MLKHLPLVPIFELTNIIHNIIKIGYFPIVWKTATVVPILKPGKDPTQAESFRPIALLSILGKVAEKIILNRLYHHVEENNILIPEQHGFRPDLSTTHQLLRVVETIKSGFKNKKSTGAVFLDIQKAFDRVWREGLIFKLIKYDFPPPLIKLISSYLTDRNFSVRINDTYSSHRPTEAGVAQGTLISPLLFNIYVNDIPIHHNTTLCMFADDTAILASHTEPKLVARAINRHLLVLEDWFSKWKIALNVAKTEAVFFTRKTRLNYPDIYLHNERIPWSQSTKYLGVTLDKKLTFKQHITRIRENFIKKAHTFSHLISRRSKLSRSNKLLIYSSLLRPVITYASPVWSFAAKTHIQKLEVLQNKTLRQILKADCTDTGSLRSRTRRRYPHRDRSHHINATTNQKAPSRNTGGSNHSHLTLNTNTKSCLPIGQAISHPEVPIGQRKLSLM
ncbi:RNA-directed DNA polymerase from mobile element jockey [Trichonephila clavipes]|nr:RNA-directed DNA polymerase from mobile element jockey [Trichonephila clavipes]